MGIFGENPQQGQFNPDNPLGIKQAPEEVTNPGQPVNDEQNNVVNGESLVGDGGEQVQQEEYQTSQEEEVIESIDIDDDLERKAVFIRQKFKSPEDFEKSIVELQKKLGRENENVTLNSPEEAIDYYITLEQELGRTSDVEQTRQENQRLQQELQGLRNTVNRLLMQNQFNQPKRDPATGRFVSANQQVNSQAQNQNKPQENDDIDISFDDIDINQFMKEFYAKGPNADSFKKVLKSVSEKIAEQKINQVLKKQQEEEQSKQQEIQQKQIQAKMLKSNYDSQVENIKQKYGEKEFKKYQNNMLNFFRKYPMYLNPQIFPNGFEIVFNEARKMAEGYQQQQNIQQNQQQYSTAQKFAARMPKSQPGQRFSRQPSQEEVEKAMLFQPANTKGLWG